MDIQRNVGRLDHIFCDRLFVDRLDYQHIVSVTEPFKLFSAASKCTSGCDNLFKEAVGQSKLLSKSTLEWVKPVMKDQTLEACAGFGVGDCRGLGPRFINGVFV